jgi:hypothetical protein
VGGLSSRIAKRSVGCNLLQFFDVFVLIFFFHIEYINIFLFDV